MKHSWWFYDGNACKKWGFDLGHCPAVGSDVFRTSRECLALCSRTNSKKPCALPLLEPCTPEQLTFSHFAATSKSGRSICLEANVRVLAAHRELTGANRFRNFRDCDYACRRNESLRGHVSFKDSYRRKY